MKDIPLQKLKVTLKKCQDLEAGLASDRKHLTACAAERIALESGLELTDREALTRMAQLEVIATIAPQWTEARMTRLESARKELMEAGHEYIRMQLRPRCAVLRLLATSRLRETLKPLYRNEEDLTTAVGASEKMGRLGQIEALTIIGGTRTEGCQAKALKLIRAWDEADEFERAQLN